MNRNISTFAGAALIAAAIAFGFWYQNYSSPYERCVRLATAQNEKVEESIHVYQVTQRPENGGRIFRMEWLGNSLPNEWAIDEAVKRLMAGEPEPIKYDLGPGAELVAVTGCAELLR